MPKVFKNYKKLIKEVYKRPIIYESQSYKETLINQAWNKVANAMGIPANICRKRWKYLRDTFQAKHSPVLMSRKKSSRKEVEAEALQWEYYKPLLFLESFLDFSASQLLTVDDERYDFQNWGEFSAEIMSKSLPYPPVVIKEEDPLADDRILAESRKRKCTITKPKIQLSDSSNSEDNAPVDDYIPSGYGKHRKKRKVKKKIPEKKNQFDNKWTGNFTVCCKKVDVALLNLLLQQEDADEEFLLSLYAALKRFTPEDKKVAKVRMKNVFGNLQKHDTPEIISVPLKEIKIE